MFQPPPLAQCDQQQEALAMDAWLTIVIRQLFIYLLPVMVSLTLVQCIESLWSKKRAPHPFFAIGWRAAWLPMLAALALHRALIFALPQPVTDGLRGAWIRVASHLLLAGFGFMIYALSLHWQPSTGLPPLHHWWCKVMMFFNLCMVALHLLPLPSLLVGEWLLGRRWPVMHRLHSRFIATPNVWLCLLAASPLLDLTLGAWIVFPPYEQLASAAFALH